MPGIENILLTFVCEAICDGLFQMKFCKLTRSVCPATPWYWRGRGRRPGSAPGAEAAEAASSPPRSWCHLRSPRVTTGKSREDPWLNRGRNLHTPSDLLIFISADVIRVSRSPIKVSAAWQQITSVTNVTPSSSHVTRRASEVWLWHHCDITDNLPMRTVPPRPPFSDSCHSLFWSLRYSDCTLHSNVHSHWLQFSQLLDCV